MPKGGARAAPAGIGAGGPRASLLAQGGLTKGGNGCAWISSPEEGGAAAPDGSDGEGRAQPKQRAAGPSPSASAPAPPNASRWAQLWVRVDVRGQPVRPLQWQCDAPLEAASSGAGAPAPAPALPPSAAASASVGQPRITWCEGYPTAGLNPHYQNLGEALPQPSPVGSRTSKWPWPQGWLKKVDGRLPPGFEPFLVRHLAAPTPQESVRCQLPRLLNLLTLNGQVVPPSAAADPKLFACLFIAKEGGRGLHLRLFQELGAAAAATTGLSFLCVDLVQGISD